MSVLRSSELSKVSGDRSKAHVGQQNVSLSNTKPSSNFDLSNLAVSEGQKVKAQRFCRNGSLYFHKSYNI